MRKNYGNKMTADNNKPSGINNINGHKKILTAGSWKLLSEKIHGAVTSIPQYSGTG